MILDMRGRRCPAPIIALGKQSRMSPGETVILLADDPAAAHDVPAWCRMTGGVLLSTGRDRATGSPSYQVRLPGAPTTSDSESKPGSSAS